jgi:hypothetical protein
MAGKLTARSAESLVKRKGRWLDGGGLFLRVLDPGKRVYWVYRYRLGNRERSRRSAVDGWSEGRFLRRSRGHFVSSAIASTLRPPITRSSRLWVTLMSALPSGRTPPSVNRRQL